MDIFEKTLERIHELSIISDSQAALAVVQIIESDILNMYQEGRLTYNEHYALYMLTTLIHDKLRIRCHLGGTHES